MDRGILGSTEHFRIKIGKFRASKSAFQNKLFADVSDHTRYSFPFGPQNYVCADVLNRTVPYTPCQTTENIRAFVLVSNLQMNTFMFTVSDLCCGFLPISSRFSEIGLQHVHSRYTTRLNNIFGSLS